jgi:hypothetical protein
LSAKVGALTLVLDSLEVHSKAVLSRNILQRLEHVEELAEKRLRRTENLEDQYFETFRKSRKRIGESFA